MTVNSKSVRDRRDLSFQSMEDLLADAEDLVASPNTRTLGNWPLRQLLTHLACTIENSMDGFQVQAPWLVRLIGPFLKRRMLTRKMSPGIKLPRNADATSFPETESNMAALERLRLAIARSKHDTMAARHPAFGPMTHDEWYQLHLRHAELHLSFARPH